VRPLDFHDIEFILEAEKHNMSSVRLLFSIDLGTFECSFVL